MLLRGLPAMGTALAREVSSDDIGWTHGDHLLAAAIDALNVANWQRGGNEANRPKPYPRPGLEPDAPMTPDDLAAAKARMAYRFAPAREE